MTTMPTAYNRVKDAPEVATTRSSGGGGLLCYGVSGTETTQTWNTEADFPYLGKITTDPISISLSSESSVNVNLQLDYGTESIGDEQVQSLILKAVEGGGTEIWNDFGGPFNATSVSTLRRTTSLSTTINLTAGEWTLTVDGYFHDDETISYTMSAFVAGLTAADTYSWTPVLRDFGSNPYNGNKNSHTVVLPANVNAGDGILIFFVGDIPFSSTWSPPSGYATVISQQTFNSNIVSVEYKVAGASEPDPVYTVSPFSDKAAFGILIIRDGPASITNTATKTITPPFGFGTETFPSLTTTNDGAMVLHGFYNESDDVQGIEDDLRFGTVIHYETPFEWQWEIQETAGLVPTRTLNYSQGSDDIFLFSMEIPV